MKSRVALATLAALVGMVLFGFTGASAQNSRTRPPQLTAPITAVNGPQVFNGNLRLTRLTRNGGKVLAEGQLTGTLLGTTPVSRALSNIPVTLTPESSASTATPAAAAPTIACPILDLVLGPLHLNLLGLVVDLNQVVLHLTAIPGAGNLLGNLLCAVANLLNLPALLPALTSLIATINAILARA